MLALLSVSLSTTLSIIDSVDTKGSSTLSIRTNCDTESDTEAHTEQGKPPFPAVQTDLQHRPAAYGSSMWMQPAGWQTQRSKYTTFQ